MFGFSDGRKVAYSATLTPICDCGKVFMARIHELPNCKYGDDWVWNCVVKTMDKPGKVVAYIEGALVAPTADQTEALRAALIKAGFTWWSRDRFKNGKKIVLERKL